MLYPQRVWKDSAMVKEFEVRSGRPVTIDFPMSPKALGDLVAVQPALAPETTTATGESSPRLCAVVRFAILPDNRRRRGHLVMRPLRFLEERVNVGGG
jgi:hypothetical protein